MLNRVIKMNFEMNSEVKKERKKSISQRFTSMSLLYIFQSAESLKVKKIIVLANLLSKILKSTYVRFLIVVL